MHDGATLSLLLKELRLPSMVKLWQELALQAKSKGWSPERYLTKLCDYELADRGQRRLSRRISESGLPRGKSLETFDFEAIPNLNKTQIMGFGKGEIWIKECMNLLIFGPSGVGKSHLAAGIGEQLVMNGYRVYSTRATEIVQKLQAAKRDLVLSSALSKLDKYDCLILDDFGYVKKNNMETTLLFELICERYERGSIIITCNQPFQEWDQIFEEKRMAIAVVDRLVHHAHILELQAESYRKKVAIARNSALCK